MKPTRSQLFSDPIAYYPAATVACFDPTTGELPRRRLDVPRTKLFLERLAQASAPAVLIAASTGHGHLRTVEELSQWFAAAADAALGDTLKMALLRPEDGLAANEKLLAQLAELQFDVVFFRPGNNLPSNASDEQVVEQLLPLVTLAAKSDLPVGIYSIPDVSGVRLSSNAAAQLVQATGDSIVAAKITEANYEQSTLAYLKHPALTRLKIVQGWDPFLCTALRDGPMHDSNQRQRVGITSGPMSFAIYQYMHVLQTAELGDWQEAEQAVAAVTSLFQAMQDDPSKFADLQRAKYIMGLGEPLLSQFQPEKVERVMTALRESPSAADRSRLARSLDLMQDGPKSAELQALVN